MIILGIETSCDETSAALVRDGDIIAHDTYTQQMHSSYGGVVPEIASRAHLEKIDVLVRHVMNTAEIGCSDIDGIAVTDQPGLAGGLLVGVSFAWGLQRAYTIPVTGINHLEGHICAVNIDNPHLEYPFLALIVSGGHTEIYRVDGFGEYRMLGATVDDAAGEAFDKVGSLLGFPYPAGREIEKCSRSYEPEKGEDTLRFSVSKLSREGMDFSFSGLKTAVRYHVESIKRENGTVNTARVCHAFQEAVVSSLLHALQNAVVRSGVERVVLAGGVACNGTLREKAREVFPRSLFLPSRALCTDNAAMIAYAGWKRFEYGMTRTPKMKPSQGL